MGEFEQNLDTVRTYHRTTYHGARGFAPGPRFMDWANQPDPFRRYSGAELLPLPLVTGPRHVDFATLDRTGCVAPNPLDAQSLSIFLELSMGLTAWKSYQGKSWALRSNASSGN
ncbi:MAG: nitroreductase, partial [Pseudomonadota bacterium]|nr:nitroreductase [Pseudomonadota bacterium]